MKDTPVYLYCHETLDYPSEDPCKLEIIKSVESCFTKNAEPIALPFQDPQQFDAFIDWDPRVGSIYYSFITNMQERFAYSKEHYQAYVTAAKTDFMFIQDLLYDYPEIAEFCFDHIEKLSKLGNFYQQFCKIKEVVTCFTKNKTFVTLSHTNRKQFEQFSKWNRCIHTMLEGFNNKIQTECLTDEKLRLAYVEAVAGKTTLDPTQPMAYQSLFNGRTKELEKFLTDHPSVTKFFYDHRVMIEALGKYYKMFRRKESSILVKDIFEEPDCFELLRQLTHVDFISRLKDKKQVENHYKILRHQKISSEYSEYIDVHCRSLYPFANNCLDIINSLIRHVDQDSGDGEGAYLRLCEIMHDGNHTPLERQETLLSYMQEVPSVGEFFEKKRHNFIVLANVHRSQHNMSFNETNKNHSALFKNHDYSEEPLENSNRVTLKTFKS